MAPPLARPERGHPELARSVADHPVTRLVDGDGYRRWAAFAPREERIVAYADKRAAPAARVDGRALRLVAPAPPGAWDATPTDGPSGRAPTGSKRTSVARPGSPGGGPAPALDGQPRCRPRARDGPATTVPLALLWGDDDLRAARAVDRYRPRSQPRAAASRWSAGWCAATPARPQT